jgi:hypothetical protein
MDDQYNTGLEGPYYKMKPIEGMEQTEQDNYWPYEAQVDSTQRDYDSWDPPDSGWSDYCVSDEAKRQTLIDNNSIPTEQNCGNVEQYLGLVMAKQNQAYGETGELLSVGNIGQISELLHQRYPLVEENKCTDTTTDGRYMLI